MEKALIRGILVTPNWGPEEVEFEDDFRNIQRLVEGHFEMPAFFPDVDIIVNEEGKFNGSTANVSLYYKGRLFDVIYGNILIVDSDDEGNTISLSDEKFEKYWKIFSKSSVKLA